MFFLGTHGQILVGLAPASCLRTPLKEHKITLNYFIYTLGTRLDIAVISS